MGTRELLILILGLAVIAVILRGLYVAMHARRRQIRLAIDKNIPQDVDLEELELAELPSGGARVIKRSPARVNLRNSLQNELDLGSGAGPDDAVPILLDSVELRKSSMSSRKPAPLAAKRDQAIDELFDGPTGSAEHKSTPSVEDTAAAGALEADAPSTVSGSRLQWVRGTDRAGQEAASRLSRLDDDGAMLEDAPVPSCGENFDSAEADVAENAVDAGAADEKYGEDSDEEYSEQYEEAGDIFSEMDEEGRREPQLELDEDLDDEFGEFSISPDDRIGAPETVSVRGADNGPRSGSVSDSRKIESKRSILSRFNRKEELPAGTARQDRAVSDADDYDDPLFFSSGANDTRMNDSRHDASMSRSGKPAQAGATASRPLPESRRAAESSTVEVGGVTDFNQARESRRSAPGSQGRVAASQPAERNEFSPSEVLVVNVMSRDGDMFRGSALLQALTTAGLKHGDMNIFHKHLGNDARGPIVFSVANILNPGTFDLDAMANFRTPGVSLFLAMPAVISNREAFEDMLRIAQQLRATLDGELRDDRRSVMTAQTIEHYRQRVQDFELRKLKAAQAQS